MVRLRPAARIDAAKPAVNGNGRPASQAVAAGAKVTLPMADMFWVDWYGLLEDPFGHKWSIATHQRDLSPQEMMDGMSKMAG